MSKKRKQDDAHHGASETKLDTVHAPEHEDEFVYVPRGKSRGFYIFILVLMVFTLIIFVVPEQFQALFSSRPQTLQEYLVWEHPTRGRTVVTPADFRQEQQRLHKFFSLQQVPNAQDLYEPESVAYFMITDALAQAAGVEVTDAEVGRTILEGSMGFLGGMGDPDPMMGLDVAGTVIQFPPFRTKETYVGTMSNWGIRTDEYEGTLRRVLRVMRYQNLLGTVVGHADPEDIEESWRERHEEFSFDVASVAVADFADEAAALEPTDDELRTWYEQLPSRTAAFADDYIQAGTSAEVVGWSVAGDEDVSALLAAFPMPEGTDLAEAAREYYDSVYHARFRREEPLLEGDDPVAQIYEPFEEVQAQATFEAPIYFALNAWLEDLTARADAGEPFDLMLEANGFGLHHEPAGDPRTTAEWRALDAWGGAYLDSALSRAGESGLTDAVVVERSGIYFGRVRERRAAGPAPFEDVREKVIAEWTKAQQGELALAAAEDLVAKVTESGVTVETFAGAALELGMSVERLDWFDPNENQAPGAERSAAEERGRIASFQDPAANELIPAALDADRERAWVLRCAGRRMPETLAIVPSEYQSLRNQAAARPYEVLFGQLLTLDAYRQRYGLETPGLDPEPPLEIEG